MTGSPSGRLPSGNPPGGVWPSDLALVYTSQTGKSVWREVGHFESESGGEIRIARHLADSGYDVVLRGTMRAPEVVTPDAWVIGAGRVEPWELKRISTRARNVQGAVQHALREGKYQAPQVVVFLDRVVTEHEVNAGMAAAMRADLGKRLRSVIFVRQDGTIQVITREAYYSGQRFRLH